MSKPAAPPYRASNWSIYYASLKRRGSLSVWFGPDPDCNMPRTGKRDHPETFSDQAIQDCLTLKVLFGLPLGPAMGLVASLILYRRSDGPLNLLIDSTGIRFHGNGWNETMGRPPRFHHP